MTGQLNAKLIIISVEQCRFHWNAGSRDRNKTRITRVVSASLLVPVWPEL